MTDQRVTQLERQNRLLKTLLILACVLSPMPLIWAAAESPKDTLTAEKIVVGSPDSEGQIVLSVDPERESASMRVQSGDRKAVVSAGKYGATCATDAGRLRASISASFDRAGVQAQKTWPKDKNPFENKELMEQPRVTLQVGNVTGQTDQPRIQLNGENGNVRAVLGAGSTKETRTGRTSKYPASSLHLYDAEGKVLYQAP